MFVRLAQLLTASGVLICTSIGQQAALAKEIMAEGPEFEQEVPIDAAVDEIWSAITDPDIVSKYCLCPLIKRDLETGGDVIYGSVDANVTGGWPIILSRLKAQLERDDS
ncbi:MAG: hypothetical protein OEQ39_03855 [Gammaproteobacteria bacterium]|nr:hypothetical protein [Gammaproteobacteria bacterium]MDH3466382.1 hypothetical protein [Gammaproteobacteria bacterium]